MRDVVLVSYPRVLQHLRDNVSRSQESLDGVVMFPQGVNCICDGERCLCVYSKQRHVNVDIARE
eukprot:CAMPEP_0206124084 /NCGR_PEP_ID=MMETSP1472-20131121/9160_1 /ASSEMBLY_ACC=CAM_ASM_001108 /TAXON_ID=41880 /ORGANISM="Pycnococcus provasolii, Strain RCC251" /LENGTH=63 /DNA_ID=CAMNT_0053514789 /DNA_START=652 /DNA_END=843 /DNA_ORIENTATION=-